MRKIIETIRWYAILMLALLAGCAGTPLSNFTHADLQNAEKIAATPERAAVWKAVDAQLTATEQANAAIAAQVKACAASVKSTVPTANMGIATLIESANNSKATIDANCKPIPLPSLLIKP